MAHLRRKLFEMGFANLGQCTSAPPIAGQFFHAMAQADPDDSRCPLWPGSKKKSHERGPCRYPTRGL